MIKSFGNPNLFRSAFVDLEVRMNQTFKLTLFMELCVHQSSTPTSAGISKGNSPAALQLPAACRWRLHYSLGQDCCSRRTSKFSNKTSKAGVWLQQLAVITINKGNGVSWQVKRQSEAVVTCRFLELFSKENEKPFTHLHLGQAEFLRTATMFQPVATTSCHSNWAPSALSFPT